MRLAADGRFPLAENVQFQFALLIWRRTFCVNEKHSAVGENYLEH
jgi:hypothetical protein